MPCLAPSEILTPQASADLGRVAERFIADDYLVFRRKRTFFPASTEDFSDIHSGFANTTLYPAFIMGNNTGLSTSQILFLKAQGLMNVPDLMTHTSGVKEYYEIKPGSPDGLAAGLAKMAALDAFYSLLDLPYRGGNRYNPSGQFEVLDGFVLGCHVKVFITFWRHAPGLILYKFCLEGELDLLAKKIGFAVMVATVLTMLLMGGGIPVPA